MNKIFMFFYVFLLAVLGVGTTLMAEDITLTTYYPAPYGAYDELTTTGNTYLATTSGNVGIGTTVPGTYKIKVLGTIDATTYSAGGTAPVADGTYTVGKGLTQDGRITVKGGIITTIQEAAN